MSQVDLEIILYPMVLGQYSLQMRLTATDGAGDQRLDPAEPIVVLLDEDLDLRLRAEAPRIGRYGQLLSAALFGHPAVKDFYRSALDRAQLLAAPLRFGLAIPRIAAHLHRQYLWEALADPLDPERPLALRQDVVFYRYLSARETRPIRPDDGATNALVVIAGGSDVGDYKPGGRALAPIDRAGELERARECLHGVTLEELCQPGRATLETLLESLASGYDILYLVCHGAMIGREPIVYLEDSLGRTKAVKGGELVRGIRDLPRQPRLVVLVSCQSAGTGEGGRSDDQGTLAGLGPQLSEEGVPAVVAMQGNISMATAEAFLPAFFRALHGHAGAVDVAMAVARRVVSNRPDAHIPVLFTRLGSGRVTIHASERKFEHWDSLLGDIERGRCTPIIGLGALEPYLGSSHEIAQRWVKKYEVPRPPHGPGDLQRIAQYIADEKAASFVYTLLDKHYREELGRRFSLETGIQADALLAAAADARRAAGELDVHDIIAALPCRNYVTVNPDGLLAAALRRAKRPPQVVACEWTGPLPGGEVPARVVDARQRPPLDQPLLCHLFGRLGDDGPPPLLCEDDYFDFLLGFGFPDNRKRRIPAETLTALVESCLLFIGFDMEDWSFRVLLHAIRTLRSGRPSEYMNIAVQLDPSDGQFADPEVARRYISKHLQGAAVTIHWATTESFLAELKALRGPPRGAA